MLSNAIKFSPLKSVIQLVGSVKDTEDKTYRVEVKITDWGIGIADFEIPLIFDPYFKSKVKETTKVNPRGIGLGLSISRKISRSMQGDLTVISPNLNGSTFTLSFPVLRQPDHQHSIENELDSIV